MTTSTNPPPPASPARSAVPRPVLSDDARTILKDMYSGQKLQGSKGPVEIDAITRVDQIKGSELNRLVRASGAKKSLEVGLAYGFSTIWILDALPEGGDHIAIDPFQESYWSGVGATQARRMPKRHFKVIEDYSIHVLSDLIRAGDRFDFIFIDGNHRFDDVLVDFYLADQILAVGGIMALDDSWMASIRTVANFVATNRAYEPVCQRSPSMAVFRKLRDDDRDWRHFRRFDVSSGQAGG
jgi:predicted O-methyltransferase YrrM